MNLVYNLFWVIWNRMEGRRKKSVKGGPSGVGGGGGGGVFRLLGPEGQIWEFFFKMSLP